MKTMQVARQDEEFEHYQRQVMLLKHIADSIEGAEFDLQRKPSHECCWEMGNVAWEDNYRVTFPDREFAPTSVEIHLNKTLSNPLADDFYRPQELIFNNKNLETDQTLCGIKINDEIYFHFEESEMTDDARDDATLLEVITLERKRLEQIEQEFLEDRIEPTGYFVDETDPNDRESQIVSLYGKIEFLNNIEKIIQDYTETINNGN